MRRPLETRWTIVKDYRKGDQDFTDTWVILYSTKEEAEAAMARLNAGQDKSWFDPAGNEYAGYDAFLYVDQITI